MHKYCATIKIIIKKSSLIQMKKKSHRSTRKKAHLRFYVPPQTWVLGCLLHESVLGESRLETHVTYGFATTEGRSNGWNLFDESEQSDASSSDPGDTKGKTLWDE